MAQKMYRNKSSIPFIHPFTQQTIWPEQYYLGPVGKPWETEEVESKLADATKDLPADAKAEKLATHIAPKIEEKPPQVDKNVPQTTPEEQALGSKRRR